MVWGLTGKEKSPIEEVKEKIEDEDYDIERKLETVREQVIDFYNQENSIYNNLDLENKRRKEVPDIEIFLDEIEDRFDSIEVELNDLNQTIEKAGSDTTKLKRILDNEGLSQEKVANIIKAIEKIEAEIEQFEAKIEDENVDPDDLLSRFTEKINNQIEELEKQLEIGN